MGTDITGWIEVKMPPQAGYLNDNDPWAGWTPLVRITRLVERNYGMFGSLFGVRNDYRFHPIATDRGLPSDLSMELEEWDDVSNPPWQFSPSWITWGEIKAIDWEERGDLIPEDKYAGTRRRDVFSPGWRTALDLMERLAQQFGDAGVRLVVWFD